MKNLFAAMSTVAVATQSNTRQPMTPERIAELKTQLRADTALNVLPNQYDNRTPYRVATRWVDRTTGEVTWTNHGNFKDLESAKFIGNIASMSLFGKKALSSPIKDRALTQASPEVVAWLENEKNVGTIEQAEAKFA